ncbi:MAG: transcription regulator [Anaerocolumna sp.]|jgi:predicted DNA-binding transcriptional regulator YafY|nr:transcription regulator [Anaerocolumna sp.]
MQVNRLFEIIYILLNKNSVTAKELAEHFEVSQRTVYRDIEVLCQSGIPIYTSQGKGGGIHLLENFVLNKSYLTKSEQEDILSALQGMSATSYPDNNQVLSKLSNIFGAKQANWIEVDFTDWSNTKKETFNLVKTAILQKQVIKFEYYSSYGMKTNRVVEPVRLWFKDKTWYLKAYCLTKNDIRTFKLNRIKNLEITDERFDRIIEEDILAMPLVSSSAVEITIKLKLDASIAYRVYDEFDENMIAKSEDGNFIVTMAYPLDEWVYGYILSFGCYAEVLEPLHVRETIKTRLEKNLSIYL